MRVKSAPTIFFVMCFLKKEIKAPLKNDSFSDLSCVCVSARMADPYGSVVCRCRATALVVSSANIPTGSVVPSATGVNLVVALLFDRNL